MKRDYAREIAIAGLKIGAIQISPEKPFRWASGYMMPVYNDNRRFLFYPDLRGIICEGLLEIVNREGINPDFVAGVATSGIPYGFALAERLDVGFVYVRSAKKGHGLERRIEGLGKDEDFGGKRGVVVEDVVSTGGSCLDAVLEVRAAEGDCREVVSVFSYDFKETRRSFHGQKPPCRVLALLSFPKLLEVAYQQAHFTNQELRLLNEWYEEPFLWGEWHGFPRQEGS